MATTQQKKIILITGANAGLGFEALKLLAHSPQPYHLIATARSLPSARTALDTLTNSTPSPQNSISLLQLDVTSDASIAAAYTHVLSTFGYLDILVLNAGIAPDRFLKALEKEHDPAALTGAVIDGEVPPAPGVEYLKESRKILNDAYDTNASSTYILHRTFAPLLLATPHPSPPRIVTVSTGLACFSTTTDPSSVFYHVDNISYKASKAGTNMLVVELRKRWARFAAPAEGKEKRKGGKWAISDIELVAMTPGFCATNLGGDPEVAKQNGAIAPEEGGRQIVDAVEGTIDKVFVEGKGLYYTDIPGGLVAW